MGRGKKGQGGFSPLVLFSGTEGVEKPERKDDRKWTEDSRPLGEEWRRRFSTSAGAGNNL